VQIINQMNYSFSTSYSVLLFDLLCYNVLDETTDHHTWVWILSRAVFAKNIYLTTLNE